MMPGSLDVSDCMIMEQHVSVITLDDTIEPGECSDNTCETDTPSVQTTENTDEALPSGPIEEKPLVQITFRDAQSFSAFSGPLQCFFKSMTDANLKVQLDENQLEIRIDEKSKSRSDEEQDDVMFVVDLTPVKQKRSGIIPRYDISSTEPLSNTKTPEPVASSRPPLSCFNCEGNHNLRDCKEPKNYLKIAQMRKQKMAGKNERYHVDLQQKYGHLRAGHISKKLRKALDLDSRELPAYIYRMRMLGYPPGWLLDAKVSHSGISLFGSDGTVVLESDDEDGEVDQEKDKYDANKIIEFPGFNVNPPEGTYDDSKRFKCPPLLPEHLRENMLKRLGVTLATAYKRRKLTSFPSSIDTSTDQDKSADMDLEDNETPVVEEKVGPAEDIREETQVETPPLNVSSAKPVDDSLIDFILERDANSSMVAPAAPPPPSIAPVLLKSIGTIEGTPLLKSCTPYTVRPSDDKWAVGVSDVINFENLPDSVGKYESLKMVIKKVQAVVKQLNQEDDA